MCKYALLIVCQQRNHCNWYFCANIKFSSWTKRFGVHEIWVFMPLKQNQLAFFCHCLNSRHCQKQILWLGLDNANSKFVKNKWRLRVLLRRNYWKTIKIKQKKCDKNKDQITLFYTEIYALRSSISIFFVHTHYPVAHSIHTLDFFFAICHAYSWVSRPGFSDKAQQLMQLQRIDKKAHCINAIKHLAAVQNNRFKSQQYVLEHQTKRKQGNKCEYEEQKK